MNHTSERPVAQCFAPALPAAMATIPKLGSKPVHSADDFRKEVMRYIDRYRTLHSTPKRPDHKAHTAVRHAFWEVRERLREMVADNHGVDGDTITALDTYSIDLGAVEIIASTDADNDDLEDAFSILTVVPRSREMAELMGGMPRTNPPHGEEDAEQEEREMVDASETRGEYRERIRIDPARMPAGEPIALSAERQNMTSVDGHVYLTRTWTKEDALACRRCMLCPFENGIPDKDDYERDNSTISCCVTIPAETVEHVIYAKTPAIDDDTRRGPGVLADTYFETTDCGHVKRTHVIAMTKPDVDASGLSADGRWLGTDSGRTTSSPRSGLTAVRGRAAPPSGKARWS